jgi:hypothetical protein
MSVLVAFAVPCLPLFSQVTPSAPKAAADEVTLQIIVVDSPEEANRILARLKLGADFAALAREKSLDPSAADGGYLGVVELTTLRSELQVALQGIKPGQITGVVNIPTGDAILKVLPSTSPVRTGINAAADLPITGKAVIRYPPATAGVAEIEGTFLQFPKPKDWNRSLQTFCELHRASISTMTGRLQTILAPENREKLSHVAPGEMINGHYALALYESYQGHMDKAIQQWLESYRLAEAHLPASVPMMNEVLGSAYFHKAEIENGVPEKPGDRCIFPPRTDVPYQKFQKTADSRKSIQFFQAYLDKKPEDLEVKWLLNLAYMSLGEYPAGVPAKYLISPAVFASKEDVGRFEDVAPQAGIDIPLVSGAMLIDDFENNGLLDVVVASYDVCTTIHYFHNNGDGTFTDRSVQSGLASIPGGQNMIQADYNNDGCLDILVLRGSWQLPMPQSLLRNNCDGTFTDVTKQAGLADKLFATQAGVWTDIDNDGWVDLFIGNEQGPAQLFHNRGDGTFENISIPAGVNQNSFSKGVVAEDYDHDGYPDLFVSNLVGDNFLYHNNHDLTFTNVAQQAGVQQSWASFATWFFDYDNDGWPDLFVASDYASVDETMRTYLDLPRSAGPLKLYKNMGDGTFKDVTKEVHLDKSFMPMGANFGDVDNDGYLDIYLGNGAPDWGSLAPKTLLRNDEGTGFTDITTSSGTGDLHKAHGIAFADLENSGQEDIAVTMGGAALSDWHPIRLFRNPGNDNNWITVKLVGVKTNRAAIGARIKVTVENQGSSVRSIYRTINSGGSFGSSPLEQHIGLGKSAKILDLEVWWPVSQTTQDFKDVSTNQFIEVQELAPTYAKLDRKQYRLGGTQENAVASADHSLNSSTNLLPAKSKE